MVLRSFGFSLWCCFTPSELRHVDEILDPGLLLGRIGRSQDFSSGRISRHRSRTRSPQNQQGTFNQKPKTWKQTSHEWDSNRVYGLTLPKIVGSNRLTREQGIAGMDIMDVPLHKVIAGGNNNWALRQVAHGRNCSVGELSLKTGSNFLWSADARASV